uniref:alpha/beta fold hydrolase n=1 Tax=Thaumasiovibrio occultus TaxID=1891184 RepID=UPI000B3540E3|nr:alpha/beta hydrolase [Thaumasiovibrio occultus]
MKIVLLPGLDGTGDLFADLLNALPSTLDVDVVSYSSISALSYSEQAQEIAARYQDEEVLLVGESYSGRVAYELCHLLGERVKGVVFLASFISRPSLYSRFAAFVPLCFLRSNLLAKWLLYMVGFNMIGGIGRVEPVFRSLEKADQNKLKARLKNIARLDKPTKTVACPVTYISPSNDRLIAKRSVQYLSSLCSDFTNIEVVGGHFIAQSNPVECAKVIADVAKHSINDEGVNTPQFD